MAKRKKKSTKSSTGASPADAPLPSFRTFEKAIAGFIDGAPSDTPLDRAQELIYQAWDIRNPAKRVALAKQAMKICPDCADAYLLLADERPNTLEQLLDLFEQAVAAGERALGPQMFDDAVGHFWGLHETRPYMRARQQLALVLWEFGDRSAAIGHAQDLLRLNPNDNQGMRDVLLNWLLDTGQLPAAQALWKHYKGDPTAFWTWSRALMAYLEHGDCKAARTHIGTAIVGNPYVAPLLLGRESLPAEQPEFVGLGDPTEAAAYVLDSVTLWQRTDGALRWLSQVIAAEPLEH